MSRSLIERYTYGNFGDLPTFSSEADFFLGGPARQRELLALTKAQISLQQSASAAYRKVGSEIATQICHELERQTALLSEILREGTERLVSAIDDLGTRLSAELAEIRWELLQLRFTNEQILQVLKRPRSTQAQELLEQGIRNLLNERLNQAEDRFLRALDLDNTDYQVLMNLSAVELRKGNAQRAREYLQDALTLPANLDRGAQAEALWSLARIHYTELDYSTAVILAKRSIDHRSTPRRCLQSGIYSVLAGDVDHGFSTIESAILSDPSIFSVAAVSPDLSFHSDRVISLLERLLRQGISQLRSDNERLLLHLSALRTLPLIAREDIEAFARQVSTIDRALTRSTYSQLRYALNLADELGKVITRYRELSAAEVELREANEVHARAASHLATAEKELAQSPKENNELGATIAGLGCLSALAGAFLGSVIGVGLFGTEALIPIGFCGFPVLVAVWILARQAQRSQRDAEVRRAREHEAAASANLAAAKTNRDRKRHNAKIPGTGYGSA